MKKLVNILLFICVCAAIGFAAPARPMLRDLTLADGTVVKNALFCGNEFGHYWLAPDGTKYTDEGEKIAENSVQFRASCAEEPARTPGIKNMAPRGLVILANFKDVHFRSMNTRAEMDSMLNAKSYTYHKSYGSAGQFFRDQSQGQYNPVFDVVGPVDLPDSLKYYGRNLTSKRGTDAMPADMVLKACSIASQIEGVDYSLYDNDNDGSLDLVFVIYAGYGESDSHVDSLIWPASWTMPAAVSVGRTSLPSNSPASAYTFQGKTMAYFAYSPELNYYNTIYRPTPGYSDSIPLRAGIGLFCHEFGHVLGLPDYYDTTNGVNYDNFLTPGNWEVMDVGLYDEDGYVPPAYSPHERWWLGWSEPILLNDTMEVTLPADNNTSYYVTRGRTVTTATAQDTVYYIENRQKTGWNTGVPGHGMLVWRVVYNSGIWSSNAPNNTANKPRYIFMPADSTYTYSKSTGLQGDDGDPFPGRDSVTSCTLFSYPIRNIREENEEIHFSFLGDSSGTALPNVQKSSEINAVYSLTGLYMGHKITNLPAGIYIVRKTTGETEKIFVR